MKYILVIDTETGGLSPEKNSIIEIAIQPCTIDGDGCEPDGPVFHRYILPRLRVEESAAAINGYNHIKWRNLGALTSEKAMRELGQFLEGLPYNEVTWAGSNVTGFDLPFVRAEMEAHGLSLPGEPKIKRRNLNTESLCYPLYAIGLVESCGLASLRRWAGLKGEQKHSAIEDVEDTIQVIDAWMRRGFRIDLPSFSE